MDNILEYKDIKTHDKNLYHLNFSTEHFRGFTYY